MARINIEISDEMAEKVLDDLPGDQELWDELANEFLEKHRDNQ